MNSMVYALGATGDFKVFFIISLVLGIVAYILLKFFLKKPPIKLNTFTGKWWLEGLSMEHRVMLPFLGRIIWLVINILYLTLLFFVIITSFVSFKDVGGFITFGDAFKMCILQLILGPIVVCLIFELVPNLVIFLFKLIYTGCVATLKFYQWVVTVCGERVAKSAAEKDQKD